MGAGRPRRHHHHAWRMEQVHEEGAILYNGVKLGEYCSTNIQVAINEGNRREDAFFVIRVGKAGTSMPFQQPIPLDFARYHPKLHVENVTLESPCGRSWTVVVRPHSHVVRFGKGWRQFSVENRLREGYQLLFTLVGKSHFVVKFFDHLGRSQTSFPPLPGAESRSQPVIDEEEHASKPQTSLAIPLESIHNITKPATPLARPATLNSHQAKIILRQYLPQLLPEVPNPKPTVPHEDMRELEADTFNARNGFPTLDGMENEHQGTQAIEEGKNYIYLDSDDDDDLVYLQAAPKQDMRKPGTSMRDIFEVVKDVNEIYSREQTGFHSPKKIEIEEDNDHLTMSKTTGSDGGMPLKYMERQKRPVTRKKVVVKRPSWEGEGIKGNVKPPSASSAPFEAATTRRGYHEVGDSSASRRAVEGGSMETLSGSSAALRLLEQQGCLRFSEIVSKCKRRHVSDKERSRVVNEAKRFASALENEKFLVVMRDAQVYQGFHLAIPREILEATGTLRANKVKVCLTDREKALYVANWEWQGFCETPLLDSDGWAKFALDHTMEEGDVCVFELMDCGPAFISGFLFCVHIFRVVEASVHDGSFIRGAQTPLNQKLGMQIGRKRPITDLDRPSLQRKMRKSSNLQPWTKLIKPRMQAHFGGSRGQRQF